MYCISEVMTLFISNNLLNCDKRIRWMKVGEEEGWLFLRGYPPTCENLTEREG